MANREKKILQNFIDTFLKQSIWVLSTWGPGEKVVGHWDRGRKGRMIMMKWVMQGDGDDVGDVGCWPALVCRVDGWVKCRVGIWWLEELSVLW